jgi:hypothetical protein
VLANCYGAQLVELLDFGCGEGAIVDPHVVDFSALAIDVVVSGNGSGSLLQTPAKKIVLELRTRRWRIAMETSKTIAGLIGPTFVAVAAGLLLNLGSISAVLEPLSRDPALVLIYGIFLFVAGLAIVRFHNHWVVSWSVLVTILGWLLVVGGLARILFPLKFAAATGDFADFEFHERPRLTIVLDQHRAWRPVPHNGSTRTRLFNIAARWSNLRLCRSRDELWK